MQKDTTEKLNTLTEELTGMVEEAVADAMPLTEQEGTELKDLEHATLASMQRVGQRFLELLIEACEGEECPETIGCDCGGRANYERHREGHPITLLDQIEVRRAYYICEECGEGTHPLDEKLDLRAGAMSPALEEMLAATGVQVASFEGASNLFKRLARVSVTDNSVRKATETIGQERLEGDEATVEAAWGAEMEMPEGPSEAPGRLYGSVDGTSVHTEEGWREAKLGSWYTTDEPPPDEPPEEWEPHAEQISYYGDITEAEDFGRLMYVTGREWGVDRAQELIFIADGAKWIWKQVEKHFPNAVQVVDWYHAAQYVWEVAHEVYGEESDLADKWAHKRLKDLWKGKVGEVISACQEHLDPTLEEDPAQKAVTYFQNNRHRMRYAEFRARGYQIGSGTIESGCKRVIGARLKEAGMIWSLQGARQVIKARAMYLSGEWNDFCAQREPQPRTYHKSAA